MQVKRDMADYDEWKEWHDAVKEQLEKLSGGTELERTYHLGKEMPWGHLDSYKPDVTWLHDNLLSFFEIEYYYDQDKIVRDIVYAALLGAHRLILIFGNKRTDWGDGYKRAQATKHLARILLPMISSPLSVEALFLEDINELKEKLKKADIL